MRVGAGCPTGPAMPPGRRFSLGGACTSPLTPHLQYLLPVHRQQRRGRGSLTGSILARLSYFGQLSISARRFRNLGNQRHSQPLDRSLPAHQARPDDRFARRCHAGRREQGIGGTQARPAALAQRAQLAGSGCLDQAFARITRSRHFAGLAAIGIHRNTTSFIRTRRDGKIKN